jgi:hypothetical protein
MTGIEKPGYWQGVSVPRIYESFPVPAFDR